MAAEILDEIIRLFQQLSQTEDQGRDLLITISTLHTAMVRQFLSERLKK